MTSTALKARCLKGNWMEQDVERHEKLLEYIHKRNTNTLTWTQTYAHLKHINQVLPAPELAASARIVANLPQRGPPTIRNPPAAVQSDPTRRHETDVVPTRARAAWSADVSASAPAPETSLRYGAKIMLVQTRRGRDAVLTVDMWSRIQGLVRVFVEEEVGIGSPRVVLPSRRNVFEVVRVDGDRGCGGVVCFGGRFRLVNRHFGGHEMALSCPQINVHNLPGASLTTTVGETQSLILIPTTATTSTLTTTFTLQRPNNSNSLLSTFSTSTAPTPVCEGDGIEVLCVAGMRRVVVHRAAPLVAMIGSKGVGGGSGSAGCGGDVFAVISVAGKNGGGGCIEDGEWRFIVVG